MNWSYWEKSTFSGERDVIIIGAGITGLNAAISLKINHPKKNVLVLERGVLPSGASTKNAGFACFGSLSELLADEKMVGMDGVLALVEKRWKGLELLRKNIGDSFLDFKQLGGFEMFRKSDESTANLCLNNIERYNEALRYVVGSEVYAVKNNLIKSFGLTEIDVLLSNNYEGQIDTGKMMQSLLKKCTDLGIELRFGMTVNSIESDKIKCANGLNFKSRNIVVATNGFAQQLLNVPLKPARAQVIITKPISTLKIQGTFHFDEGYYYFRNIHNRLLIGGGRNMDFEEEETTKMVVTSKIQDSIKKIIDKHILCDQKYEIDYAWSGIMGVGTDKKPLVKRINENMVVAVRLGGMGVAIGSLIGQEAAKLISNALS